MNHQRRVRYLLALACAISVACNTEPDASTPGYTMPVRDAFALPARTQQRNCLAGVQYETTHATLPQLISATGCFDDPATLKPAADMVPYGVQSPLWTDGAVKDRFVALPPDTQIAWADASRWILPEGTVLVKNFAFALSGTEDHLTNVETRFMLKTYQGWRFFNYHWNEQGTDATLVDEHTTPTYAVMQTDGAIRQQEYLVPNAAECAFCHSPATPGELAFKPLQQHGSFSYAAGKRAQLEALIAAGYLQEFDLAQVAYLRPTTDTGVPAEARARAYLEANCAHCHRPNGFTSTDLTMDLRYEVPLSETGLCEEVQFFAPPGTLRVAPGNPVESYVLYRMGQRGIDRMPPLGSEVTDPTGMHIMAEWINRMESCP